MKLTKYQHACFVVEKNGQQLVVDPGTYSHDFVSPANVTAIVITHIHGDHFDPAKIVAIVELNPEVIVYGPQNVIDKLPDGATGKVVFAGSHETSGPFTLEFFGGDHAVIHPTIPIEQNIGVMINDSLYYPGDSYSMPNKPVAVLALPAAAPWMKIAESLDFMTTIKPIFAFPTHDEIMSEDGRNLTDMLAKRFAEPIGTRYQRIQGTIDIDG